MLDTPCVGQIPVTFRCPIWNVDPRREPDVEGDFRLRCEVCGLARYPLRDLDSRKGHLLLDVQFGPNTFRGSIFEVGINGYAVFLTDLDGQRISEDPVAMVPAHEEEEVNYYCCRDTAYTVRVATEFPSDADAVLLEVVPVTGAGPLPAGRLTGAVRDMGVRAAVASARPRAVTPRAGCAILSATVAIGAAVAELRG